MFKHRPGPLALVLISTVLLQLATPALAWADEETPPPEAPAEPMPSAEAEPVPTVAEILAQAPAGTGLLVVDGTGEPEPLATLAAAEALATSDPVWCRAGYVPTDDPSGGTYCTSPQASVTAMLDEVGADPVTYSGDGTIFFTTDYAIDDAYIHGSDARLATLAALAIDGMGHGFTVPLEVIGWRFDVQVADLIMDLSTYGTPAAGLRVDAAGGILVADVSVTGSGGGAYLDNADGTGSIQVTDGTFSGNSWTGLDARSAGDISLQNVVATGNEYGAYLDASAGAGSVTVDGGDFSDSALGALTARTSTGNITLTNVTADGSTAPGSYGAGLTSTGGGSISVTSGSFQDNAGKGLWTEASGSVALVTVNASGNGLHGAYIHNLGACAATPINVTIDGGTYQNNTGYGALAVLGPGGTLTVSGSPVWGGNGAGDYYADLNPCPACEGKPDGKPFNVVYVPETGGAPVPLDCIGYAGTVLILPDGTRTTLVCPVSEQATFESLTEAGLPAPLPSPRTFVAGVHLTILQGGAPLPVILEDGYITLAFAIPEEWRDASLTVLYWDTGLNSGAGGWVELPPYALLPDGSPMPHRLHPDVTPDDQMRILGGVRVVGAYVKVAVNFPGIFILAER